MSYSADPVRFDAQLRIGDTWTLVLELVDDAGAAYDITGATGTCTIATEPGGTTLASPTVSLVTDGTDGAVQAVLSAATTAALQAQEAQYGLRLTFADSTKKTIVEGRVTITAGVL